MIKMEAIEEFRRQVFNVRDRYHDILEKKFMEVYQDQDQDQDQYIPNGGSFEISVSYLPHNSFGFEHAITKFKKTIGKLGFKVIEVRDGDNIDSSSMNVKRLTIQRKDQKIRHNKECVIT